MITKEMQKLAGVQITESEDYKPYLTEGISRTGITSLSHAGSLFLEDIMNAFVPSIAKHEGIQFGSPSWVSFKGSIEVWSRHNTVAYALKLENSGSKFTISLYAGSYPNNDEDSFQGLVGSNDVARGRPNATITFGWDTTAKEIVSKLEKELKKIGIMRL